MAKTPDDRDPAWLAHKERTTRPRYDEPAFTEDFLARFSDEDAAAVRRFGQMIKDATLEYYGAYDSSPEEPFTLCAIKAVVADLRTLEHRLADLSKNEEHLEDQEEIRLCRLAGQKAFVVAQIADAIEREISLGNQVLKPSDEG